MFRQPAGAQKFDPFDPTASRANFDYAAWLKANGLTELVASNWHVTQHTDPPPNATSAAAADAAAAAATNTNLRSSTGIH